MKSQKSGLPTRFLAEWHPVKNGHLKPSAFSPGSNKKVWWKCPKGVDHEWQAMVIKRSRGQGCPFCSGHKVAKSTSLGSLRPEVANEWHPTKNGNLTPFDVSVGSGKKIWWLCFKDKTHEWEALVNNRNKGSACPICKNKKTVESNSLGKLNPNLANEWHQSKNGSLTPFDVTPGSNKRVWWQCKRSNRHEWRTAVASRSKGTGCPHCGVSTSRPELRIYAELKTIFSSIEHRVNINGYEVDVFIPEIKLGIEYDGQYWHRGKILRDKQKNDALKDFLHLIRIREPGLPKVADFDIQLKDTAITIEVVKAILKITVDHDLPLSSSKRKSIERYLRRNSWAALEEYKNLLVEKSQVAFRESISFLRPDLAEQWHPSKNFPLLPENFAKGSNEKVWWKCPIASDHEWEASVYSRTLGGGCPVCINKKVVSSNSLAVISPGLVAEWNYSRNKGISPYDVGLGSNKKVWWKCPNGADHEWQAMVIKRSRGQGCPFCANKKINNSNSLATLRSDLANQWHKLKNENLSPSDVSPGSNKIVWWQCDKRRDHEWRASVHSRTIGHGCPYCTNQKISASNSLAAIDPRLTKQWHPSKNGKVTPFDVSPNTHKKHWWLGSCGHEWEASVNNRRNGRGCPKCKHKRAKKTRTTNKVNKNQLAFDDVLD